MLTKYLSGIALIVTVLGCFTDGNQRVVYVSELMSDGEDFIASGESNGEDFIASGESDNSLTCCVYRNCSCSSLDHALANLTSNVLINITTDVTLSSLVEVSYVENVTIIGHNNPTVNCRRFGGMHFTNSVNFIIEGIIWDGCGIENSQPAIKVNNSSNISITNCLFQYSRGQAVLLSDVLGDVSISHCNFVYSNHRGHGAAIHYSSNDHEYHSLSPVFTISHCNFAYNIFVISLVYIETINSEHNSSIRFYSTQFQYNYAATSIYVVNQEIHLNGQNLFQDNTATQPVFASYEHSSVIFGTNSIIIFQNNDAQRIFISHDHSTVTFGQNSTVLFQNNTAQEIFVSRVHSTVIFGENSIVTFQNNDAQRIFISHGHSTVTFGQNSTVLYQNNVAYGIFVGRDHSTVIFGQNSNVTFLQNTVAIFGYGIFFLHRSKSIFDQKSEATFNSNEATGSSIYFQVNSNTTFMGTCQVIFSNNTDATLLSVEERSTPNRLRGAVIRSTNNSYISFEGNSATVFNNNNMSIGVIYSGFNSCIYFKGNSTTVFKSNRAYTGIIYSVSNSYIHFEEKSITVFKNNAALVCGGIYSAFNSYIFFEQTSFAEFSNNTGVFGGAMRVESNSSIFFRNNSSPVFSNNNAFDGGAIYCSLNSFITFEGNFSPEFNHNNVRHFGGAIYSGNDSNISFEGYSAVVFRNNIADDDGGAIFSLSNSHIVFKGTSSLQFNHNAAGNHGGSIHSAIGSHISFEGFSSVVFRNNSAGFDGGAMFARDYSNITFSHNSTVTFTNNRATVGATVFSDSKVIRTANSSVMFHNLTARWCTDTCLPYTDQDNVPVVTIDGNGLVWCSDQNLFECLSEKCYCRKLEDLLDGIQNNALVNITETVTLSSFYRLQRLRNISIIGYNNITVMCVNGGGLNVCYCNNVTIEGITWIGCGRYDNIDVDHVPVAYFLYTNKVIIQKCTFQYSFGVAIYAYTTDDGLYISKCNFINNNHYTEHGALIYYNTHPNRIITNIHIINCNFSYNGDARSMIYFGNANVPIEFVTDIYLNTSEFHNNRGVSVYLSTAYNLHVSGQMMFKDNVADNGAGIYITHDCKVIFHNISNAKFINNSVFQNGAAIYTHLHSNVIFEQNSIVAFTDNKATNGTIYSEVSSNVTFTANCEVTFNDNTAAQCGAAIYSADNSHVTFTGHSKVTFRNNVVSSEDMSLLHNGTIYSESNGYVSFEEKSSTVFTNNIADFGTAIFSFLFSIIAFRGSSRVTFNNNIAQHCGVLTSVLFSNNTFEDNAKVTYNGNTISSCLSNSNQPSVAASAMCTFQRSDVTFSGHSSVTFANNTSGGGGAVAFSDSNVIIGEYATAIFYNNNAQYSSGGALTCYNSNIKIQGNSNVTFKSNRANQDGSTIYSPYMCKITFKDNSTSTFINNTARNNGGAIFSTQPSEVTFEGHSTVTFDHNAAENGGVFYLTNSTVTFKESSTISFNNNEASQSGGVAYFSLNSNVIYEGMSRVRFDSNTALHGGALSADDHCNITITESSVILFVNNEATQSGGAGYFNSHCYLTLNKSANLTFDSNRAIHGGALFLNMLNDFVVEGNSTLLFYNNLVTEDGGGMKALNSSRIILNDNINMRFSRNSAQYGGAMFLDATAVLVNNSNKNYINFENNFARILGNSVYQDVSEVCNGSCLESRLTGVSGELIATPPNELTFDDPAICIDNDENESDTQCNNYYLQNIMLGAEITIPACVLDYYNKPVDSIHFLVQTEAYSNYSSIGPDQILISCDRFEGIHIIGNQSLKNSTNLSITITLNTALYPQWEQISVNLTIELSPCHPGFWQYPNTQTCECYNADNIVFCSGSNSTIRRGYWFGTVTGKPTVTFCPINYCNFTCCETSNGYYHLSPIRDNQCRSHRSGIACGSCKEGYTLSFDSAECVNTNSCTTGITVLVILLTVIYWIVMVTSVFAMMYYKVEIGYLYSITYYYSIVDILLSQHMQASRGLYLTTNIISSFSKITPQFLGELCLTTGLSGIDQQIIHYTHPSAVIIILVIITLLARRSRRISAIISRGIIHVICLLLLLSYTSIASTSLLLMRPLTFRDIDNIYTYLSPDIGYFYGRHLAYGIVALICTVTVVLGLPLILSLEPFLNSKCNFTKIKPLLDQFQGCYKDKYRCFAGYYMICRLVIITIVIVNSSNEVANYLLVIICGIANLIHVMVKPYRKEILNKLDGIILHLLIFVAALSLLEDFDSSSVITSAFVLVILPLLIFIAMTLFLHKDDLKKIIAQLKVQRKPKSDTIADNNEIPMKEFDLIIDDNMRNNATICAISTQAKDGVVGDKDGNFGGYRDSFLEVMDIKD